MRIWVHTLVKNEERYIWYSVMSVIEFIDRILIWDTGSSDNTTAIIKEIQKLYPKKVDFSEVGEVDEEKFTEIRQKMLDETKSDWFMILDGDEVWWEDAIKKHLEIIQKRGKELDSIVSRYFNVVGDIYHYQEEIAGRYRLDNQLGHLNIRFVNRWIEGLCFKKPHGQQGLYDVKGNLIQDRNKNKRIFIDDPSYLHFTNLVRSSSIEEDWKVPKREIKFKYDLGISFPLDFYYPEVFFKPRPKIVPSPWFNRTKGYALKAAFLRPFQIFRRRVFKYGKEGY